MFIVFGHVSLIQEKERILPIQLYLNSLIKNVSFFYTLSYNWKVNIDFAILSTPTINLECSLLLFFFFMKGMIRLELVGNFPLYVTRGLSLSRNSLLYRLIIIFSVSNNNKNTNYLIVINIIIRAYSIKYCYKWIHKKKMFKHVRVN